MQGSEWNIRGRRSRRFHDLYDCISAIEPPAPEKGRDVIMWKHGDDDYKPIFSAARTWDQIRVKKSKVEWSRVVWFTQGVPRFCFITWLAVKNRLSTGDRMRDWGIVQGCELCGERDETREHLFFACPYSYTIWESLARKFVGRNINPDWQWTCKTGCSEWRVRALTPFLQRYCSKRKCTTYGGREIQGVINKLGALLINFADS